MRNKILITIFACMALAGCMPHSASQPARFYGLYSPNVSQTRGPATTTNVAIDYASVPQSVDRPQIVIRQSGSTVLNVAEFDRWIEELNTALPVIMSENMNAYARNIAARPGHGGIKRNAKYIVSVDFVRFETESDGKITVSAWWTISDSRGDALVQKKNTFTAATPENIASNRPDYDAIVDTYSKLIAKLSYKIADTLSELK